MFLRYFTSAGSLVCLMILPGRGNPLANLASLVYLRSEGWQRNLGYLPHDIHVSLVLTWSLPKQGILPPPAHARSAMGYIYTSHSTNGLDWTGSTEPIVSSRSNGGTHANIS